MSLFLVVQNIINCMETYYSKVYFLYLNIMLELEEGKSGLGDTPGPYIKFFFTYEQTVRCVCLFLKT